jgi:hypothetical protein
MSVRHCTQRSPPFLLLDMSATEQTHRGGSGNLATTYALGI